MEQQPSPLQYSGGHVALWHWASTQRSWSGGPLNAILADRRHANLFDRLWFFQVRVYHQAEGPAVVSPRRAPMLFARADEIIEPGKSGSGTRSEEAASTHGRNAGLKSVVAKSQAISCGPPLSGWPANFFSQANEVMSARGKIRKSIDSKNLAKVDFWTFPAQRGSV